MKKKCSLPIELDINVKHFILLITIICSFIIFEYRYLINIYTYDLANVISLLISLISFIIIKLSFKGNHKEKNKKIKKIIENTEQYKLKSTKQLILNVFIIFLLYLFIETINYYIYFIEKKRILLIFHSFSIYTMVIFEHFCLKENIHFHHFISLIFIFFFNTFHPNFKKTVVYGNCQLSSIIYYFIEGIILFIVKYIMDNKFISPYLISLVKSFITFGFSLIKFILQTYYFDEQNKNYYYPTNYFYIYNGEYFKQMLMFVSFLIYPIFCTLLIYYFSPYYYVISIQIGGLYNFKNLNYIIHFIGTSISLLVFSEIIIINFCGMSDFTRKKIEERSNINYNNDYCEINIETSDYVSSENKSIDS